MTKLGDLELITAGKYVAIVGVIVLALICIGLGIYGAGHSAGLSETKTTEIAAIATPVPTVVATASPYPPAITFTVLSTTTSSGHYQVLTTTGQILYCNNYYSWNGIEPQDSYTATVTGTDGSAYLISNPVMIAQHYSYTNYRDSYYDSVRYYNYNGQYWQCDGNLCDLVSWKQTRGERIIYGKPPTYGSYDQYGSGNPDRSIAYGSGNPWQGD